MKVHLEAPIAVERIAVFAELAWLERRPELGLLCRAARDAGGHLTPEIVQAALPGLAAAGARNVIAWCRTLGLIDGGDTLTQLGEEVARSDEAPVPEQGVYDLWLAQHPLLGRRVLAVARVSASGRLGPEGPAPLPFEPEQLVIFRSVIDPSERFVLGGFPTNHGDTRCVRGATAARCRLRWRLDLDAGRDEWWLEGTIEEAVAPPRERMAPVQHEPEAAGIDLWGLVDAWGAGPLRAHGRWQPAERRLAVQLDGLTAEEQDGFQQTLRLERAEVPGKGSYEGVRLEDVPIGPASAQGAQRWARARLDRRLAAKPVYRSRAAVRELFGELVRGTPLERFAPELPAHDELAQAALSEHGPALYWSLVAPVDLAPRPVSPEELGPLRAGAGAQAPAGGAPAQHAGGLT